ncbi:hypothetical protein CONLIGDRAFT_682951 [Coniochaeta ligniaria NRRL 30616]|uniref:Myb-like domain-containing protein n=1 Tax=Coniochaeta ligniaria NRRL 30616 TaxID=1408157 RepID=A0A1J7IK53_9PEZI|nr:hypothetical protein CONLIGDRAFT_682951 [Coniochaeta ligniaria NRRL 30616]
MTMERSLSSRQLVLSALIARLSEPDKARFQEAVHGLNIISVTQEYYRAVATVAVIAGLTPVPLPGASRDSETYRDTHQRNTQAPVLCAHEIDGHLGTNPRVSVIVDIASLLKGSAANASSATPSQQSQSSQATPIPAAATAATTLPPIIGPPSSYADVAAPSIAVSYGARARRNMPQSQASDSQAAKKQSKWSAEEDALIIELRGSGMKWDDISKRLPGRSPISCRLHYQNYLEKRSEWDEERKNKLARLYERFKPEMWAKVAEEMQVPWRAAEAMHWQLGEADMARRAGVTPFSLQAPGPEGQHGTQLYHHRTSPSRGHGYSPSHGGGASHGMPSPRYGRTPVPGGMSAHGPPLGPPPGHGIGAVPPPPHATIPSPISGAGTLAARRESIPPRHQHYHHHLQPPSPHEGYSMPGPGLPPLQPGGPGQGRGMLPGVAELTTGISPYSTPAYSLSVPSGSPVASGTASPGPGGSGHTLPPLSSYRHPSPLPPPHQYPQQQFQQQQYQPQQSYEPTPSSTAAGKRRASPEVMARETSRRRHLDKQPRQQQYDDGDSSGSQRTR